MVRPKLTDGYLFDIQGFSVHDGPGCRTLIFLKGCSLHCSWCSNPEGINSFPEPLYKSSKCLYDLLCIESCRQMAITANADSLSFDRNICKNCTDYECETACCSGALKIAGYRIREDELMKKIQRDRQYWGTSGGITLTGGEPFLQPLFVSRLLLRCFESYIHTAVETCGNVPWKNIESSLEHLDWIFYDLKQIDPVKHRSWTGTGNELILANARKLAEIYHGRLVFRLPLVTGFNDDDDHIQQLAEFIVSIRKNEINLLPVHHLGREKYSLLGSEYYTDNFIPVPKENLTHIQSIFREHDIYCYIGSETPF